MCDQKNLDYKMSSKSVGHPRRSAILKQDPDDMLSSSYSQFRQHELPSAPPSLDLKLLVDYFGDYTKKLHKMSSGYPYGEERTSRSDMDEKNLNIIGSINQLNNRYKTELCRPFTEEGECKYANKCQYAHGTHELRPIFRHLKHKTKLCHKYHTTGFCNYGSRCTYIHREDDSKFSSISPPPVASPIANNAFSFPPLVRLPSFSSSSSESNSHESRNSSPLSFEGSNFAASPYFSSL